jgi:hypothetical protein
VGERETERERKGCGLRERSRVARCERETEGRESEWI